MLLSANRDILLAALPARYLVPLISHSVIATCQSEERMILDSTRPLSESPFSFLVPQEMWISQPS